MAWLRVAAVVLLLAAPAAATAGTPGTMTPVSDDRSIVAFGEPFDPVDLCGPFESFSATPSPPFSVFDDTVSGGENGWAEQSSEVGTGTLIGGGYAIGYSDYCYGMGYSTYDVTFTLSGWARLALTGGLRTTEFTCCGYAETTARLTRGSDVLYEESADPFSGPVPLSYTDSLPPGTYRLFLEAHGNVAIESLWSFRLEADPVAAPVPALGPAPLLALALLLAASGSAATRRRV